MEDLMLEGAPRRGRPRRDLFSLEGEMTEGQVRAQERKTSIYLKGDTLEQIRTTAARLDRSVSWILQRAYQIARTELESVAVGDSPTSEDKDDDLGI